MKRQKMISIDEDVYAELQKLENASVYICDLIRADVAKIKAKKEIVSDLSQIAEDVDIKKEIEERRKAERDERLRVFKELSSDVKEPITKLYNMMKLWDDVFFPIYAKNGTLTLEDVEKEIKARKLITYEEYKAQRDAIAKEAARAAENHQE